MIKKTCSSSRIIKCGELDGVRQFSDSPFIHEPFSPMWGESTGLFCLQDLIIRPVMCWWPWSSSPLTSLKAFTWTAKRRTWGPGTRWVAGEAGVPDVLKQMCWSRLPCWCCWWCRRAWCSATPRMRRRSACPSPSSWLTSSTWRWQSCAETGHFRGSALIPKHRSAGKMDSSHFLREGFFEILIFLPLRWLSSTGRSVVPWCHCASTPSWYPCSTTRQ